VNLESRFARRDWGPAELNGGRLAEALLRYLEWKESGGSFTRIGEELDRTRVTNRVKNNPKLPKGLRFHVLACAGLLLDVRNKRDVAHLGEVIDVSEMDAHLVMRLASWALSEVIREESGLPPKEIQQLIDQLSARRIALVEEIGGRLVIVATSLAREHQALVALYHTFPDSISIKDLQAAVRYKNGTEFRRNIIGTLEKDARVHRESDRVVLTRKGVSWIETHIDMRLEV
jgi:hypothetical protein